MSQHDDHDPIDLAREAEFALGTVCIKPSSREVIVDGQAEIYEPRVLQVLVALAKRRGNVVSREELSLRCWENRKVSDDALNRCISRIRRLAQASGEFTIETIPRVGYRLAVNEIAESVVRAPLPRQQRGANFIKRHVRVLSFALLAFGILILAAYFVPRDSGAVRAALDENKVIVLPFESLTEGPESKLYAQTISAAINNVLSRSGVSPISPAKTEKSRGRERAQAVDEAGAHFVIDGEVSRDGNVIRAVIRIDNGRTGRTLMSSVFESNTGNPGRMADLIAGYIGERSCVFSLCAIHSNQNEVEEMRFRTFGLLMNGESRAAYDLVTAIAQKYPDEAEAQLMLSIHAGFSYWLLSKEEVEPAMLAGRLAAKRANALAPNFGDTYFAMSNLVPPQRWAQREDYLRTGLKVDPDAPTIGLYLAGFLAQVGRMRDAELQAAGAVARDPFNPFKIRRHFMILRMLGNEADADVLIRMGSRYWPGNAGFAFDGFLASDFRGSAPQATNMMRDPAVVAVIEPDVRQPAVRQVLQALSSRQATDIDAAVNGCLGVWVSSQATQVCLLGMSELGRTDDAFKFGLRNFPDMRAATPTLEDEQWLRRERSFFDSTVLYRAELKPMRADVRFIALAERLGLLDYWRGGHTPDFCESERVPVCAALHEIGKP